MLLSLSFGLACLVALGNARSVGEVDPDKVDPEVTVGNGQVNNQKPKRKY